MFSLNPPLLSSCPRPSHSPLVVCQLWAWLCGWDLHEPRSDWTVWIFSVREKNIFCVEERTTLCGVNMDHCPRQPLLRTYFRSYHIIVDHIYRDCEFFFIALFSFFCHFNIAIYWMCVVLPCLFFISQDDKTMSLLPPVGGSISLHNLIQLQFQHKILVCEAKSRLFWIQNRNNKI